ncbi:MAG: hypothetical protein R2826_01485 [Thermoleophilia bacterium]
MDDYYEGVVIEYLRADPTMFVRPQCCIQLHPGSLKACDEHWYCDAVAVRFREPITVFLCKVTFAKTPVALFNRLRAWREHWPDVCAALASENGLAEAWPVQPWVFVRGDRRAFVARKLDEILHPLGGPGQMPEPLITGLEDVTPWRYKLPLLLPTASDGKQ